MEKETKTGFSPGVSSGSSPPSAETTSGSYAPLAVTVKARRVEAGMQPTAREASTAPRMNRVLPATPAISAKPEIFDLTNNEDAMSINSSSPGAAYSVSSSTVELLAAKKVIQ